MSPAIAGDICRVTVMGPRRKVDIALPANVPFADLFPTIARFCGLDHSDLVREPGGWVLQRLGQSPFALSSTPGSEGLFDGELLYLRPKSVEMPPLASDDIADDIASVHDGPGRWTQADAPRIGIGAGAIGLAAGAVLLARSGPHWSMPAIAAGVLALILLAAATSVSRAAGNATVATVLGCAALPYAFVAGMAGVASTLHTPAAQHSSILPASALGMLTGSALVMLAAIIAAIGVARGLPAFLGVAVAALFGLGAGAVAYADPSVTATGAAALMASPALALTPLIPSVAFRIAGLSMPRMPASPEDLRNDALIAPQPDVRSRAFVADRAVTGAACGMGLVGAGAEIALGLGHGALTALTAAVLACAMLLQSRLFRGRAQRLWLLFPGYAGLSWLAIATGHVASIAALVVSAGLVVAVGSWLPAHRPSPFWGRAADIVDTLLIVALIPLALGVAGVLSYLHGLNG